MTALPELQLETPQNHTVPMRRLMGVALAVIGTAALLALIQDIRGIGWAWIIHFFQDILVFTTTLALFV